MTDDDKIIQFPTRAPTWPTGVKVTGLNDAGRRFLDEVLGGKQIKVTPANRRGIRTFRGMWQPGNDDGGPAAA